MLLLDTGLVVVTTVEDVVIRITKSKTILEKTYQSLKIMKDY